MKMRSKKGFTLMEILIVVAIIGIWVAIAVPTFSVALEKANIAADKANIRALYAECMMDCMLNDGEFPNGVQFLQKMGKLQSKKYMYYEYIETVDPTKPSAPTSIIIHFDDLELPVKGVDFSAQCPSGTPGDMFTYNTR